MFDVKSLFTYAPLDHTIVIILKRVYEKHDVSTDTGRKQMKELPKNIPFKFDSNTYQQRDNVAMGSPLGPVLAGIAMVVPEKCVAPKLKDLLCFWKRYVYGTLTLRKK